MKDHGWVWSPWWIYGTLVMCAVGLLAALLFVGDYQRRVGWTWWRQEDGTRNLTGAWLMAWGVSRVLVLGLTLVNWAAGPWPGMLPASFLVMAFFCLHTFIPYRLLAKAQDRRTTPKEEPREHLHH